MFKGGLGDLLSQAGKIKEEAARLKDAMGAKTCEASVGGGMVKVVANGKQQIVSLHIDPELMKDPQMLNDLVVAGVNQALKAAQDLMAEEMKKMMGGFGPLASLFGK